MGRNKPDTLGPMKVSAIVLLCLALFAATAQQKPGKSADVQILETKAVRDGANISGDGKVRVIGAKTLVGVRLVFELRSLDKEGVPSQRCIIREDILKAARE